VDLRAHRVDALVLRAIAYGEADAVVHLLVRGRGRISAFARGARSSRKRFGGALEPFQRVEALVAEREGQELWALREARVVEAHPRLRDDLHRIAHAGYAAELIHELTRAGQPADALFALMEDFLTRLEAGVANSARSSCSRSNRRGSRRSSGRARGAAPKFLPGARDSIPTPAASSARGVPVRRGRGRPWP